MVKVDRRNQPIRANIFRSGFVLMVGFLLSISFWAMAHEGAMGIVKERMDLMESVGDAMKRLKNMMRSSNEFDALVVQSAANSITGHAMEMLKLFPDGSLEHPTRAKAAIWEKWERFSDLAMQMENYSRSLATAAKNISKMQGMMHGSSAKMGEAVDGANRVSGNMMGGSMMGESMMGNGGMTASEDHLMSDPGALKNMPPQASFKRLTQVCKDCHTDFRAKKN